MTNTTTSRAQAFDPSATPWTAEPRRDGFFDVVSATGIVLAEKCIEEEAGLFAAAPDLLDACRKLVDTLDDWFDVCDFDDRERFIAAKNRATAAIRKTIPPSRS